MKFVKSFNQVNEALGIADATLFYVDIIKQKVMEEVVDYINDCITLNKKEIKNIVIPYRELRRHVTNWEVYKIFPVSEILIDVEVVKRRKDNIKKIKFLTSTKEEIPFKVGGYASTFARGRERAAARIKDPVRMAVDHSLLIHMGIKVEYSSNFNLYTHERKLEAQIESVILHELNHTYEYYNRRLGGAKNIDLALTYAATGTNRMRRPKELFEYWQYYFTDFIYMSEPHEIRAYIQESKSFIDKLDFESFQKTNTWKVVKYMQEYSYKDFLDNFNKIVYKHNPEYVGKITDTLVKDFIREYTKYLEEFKEEPLISPEKLTYMTTERFFQYWEKVIRKAGDKMIRGMSRLYAYKKNKEEELY